MSALELALVLAIAFLAAWSLVLTFLYFTAVRHYKSLKVGDKKSLDEAFRVIFAGMEKLNSQQTETSANLSALRESSRGFVQKVAIKRFNPFGDTGSDQSFILVLLDENGTGAVLSSLHGRSGTRVYAKPITEGEPGEYELSDEEREVLSSALDK